eukprot:CAMPEP_0181312804 /NCGR_PEP_ID=MMETSP1101-20121128/13895_1 /TAXON_ID=46948 /ORGANISM="Rhodomonas abbreviata, Strain Caron Lab Isolate" /LENGTH=241 /DNA_ID=CAMNT_0023419685 /DNA_START=164 /DNA_END=885 /DNA_ORIENTATION=+
MTARWAILLACGVFLAFTATAAAFEADDEDTDWENRRDESKSTVLMEHSLGGNDEFKPRCKLTYSAPRHGGSKSRRTVSVHIEQTTFSAADLQRLQELSDAGKHYKIRVPSDVSDPDSPKVVASVPACLLIASDFHEMLRVHVDQFGHLRSLWYQTMALACPAARAVVPQESVAVVTSVAVDMESRGAKVPLEPVPKAEEEAEKKIQEQPTFFAKYWHYIIGGVILMVFLQGEEPKEGEGG